MTCDHRNYDTHIKETITEIITWRTCARCGTEHARSTARKITPSKPGKGEIVVNGDQ